ncbi:MAG: hypothetical protein SGARI_000541 [Bacillariaceae sp.]
MWLHDELWDTQCVKVTGFAKQVKNEAGKRGYTPVDYDNDDLTKGYHNAAGGAVRVFDTGDSTNCDEDLFTPSPKFTTAHPGVKCKDCCGGGPFLMEHTSGSTCVNTTTPATPNPYVNDQYLGNVLILQEYQGGNHESEMGECPDDTGKGGYILFEFCQAVDVIAGRLLDVDGAESADIVFTYEDLSTETVDVGTTGDNGYWRYEYQRNNVISVKVEYTGSGSVEGLEYSYCPDDTARRSLEALRGQGPALRGSN